MIPCMNLHLREIIESQFAQAGGQTGIPPEVSQHKTMQLNIYEFNMLLNCRCSDPMDLYLVRVENGAGKTAGAWWRCYLDTQDFDYPTEIPIETQRSILASWRARGTTIFSQLAGLVKAWSHRHCMEKSSYQ